MRIAILAISVLAAACGGGSDDEIKVEHSDPPGVWIKLCRPGQFFCTLTLGSCDTVDADSSCTVCDPSKPLSQC